MSFLPLFLLRFTGEAQVGDTAEVILLATDNSGFHETKQFS